MHLYLNADANADANVDADAEISKWSIPLLLIKCDPFHSTFFINSSLKQLFRSVLHNLVKFRRKPL